MGFALDPFPFFNGDLVEPFLKGCLVEFFPTATLELPFPKGDLDDEDGEPFPKGFFTFPFAGVLFMACIAFPMATLSTESNLCQNGLQINIYYVFLNTQKNMEHDFVFKVDVCFKETVDLSWE